MDLKIFSRLAVGAFAMLVVLATPLRADIERFYVLGQDGCSQYIFYHNTQYNTWFLYYSCCGSQQWCWDTGVVSDPCGGGWSVYPTGGTGIPVTYDSAGNEIVTVAPGHGGHVGNESGVCRSFVPDGSSTLVIPPWELH
ncbi:MAG TPA: hypothetical protein VHI13_13640 [Candidatus Kapabacteria bacterium]|nr:hypothetical protein [Candidatus Kapabacteria bacterium]